MVVNEDCTASIDVNLIGNFTSVWNRSGVDDHISLALSVENKANESNSKKSEFINHNCLTMVKNSEDVLNGLLLQSNYSYSLNKSRQDTRIILELCHQPHKLELTACQENDVNGDIRLKSGNICISLESSHGFITGLLCSRVIA